MTLTSGKRQTVAQARHSCPTLASASPQPLLLLLGLCLKDGPKVPGLSI